jgi:hypothetical protein
MPGGSREVNGFKAYVAATRHTKASYLVTSDAAERQEVRARRPLNDFRPITQADVIANLVRNLERQPEKLSATQMIRRAATLHRASAVARPLHAAERRVAEGRDRTTLHESFARRHRMRHVQALSQRALSLGHMMAERLERVLAPSQRRSQRQHPGQGMGH